MNDRLRADADAWQAPGATPPTSFTSESTTQHRKSQSPRLYLGLAAAAVIICVVAAAHLVPRGRHNSLSSRPLVSHSYSGLTLTFPGGWKSIRPSFATAALQYPLAYITNARLSPQCDNGCHAPVTRLDEGQIVISVLANPMLRKFTTFNSTVAGKPSTVTSRSGRSPSCPRGTRYMIFADIALPANNGISVDTCIGGGIHTERSLIAQVTTMLETATYV